MASGDGTAALVVALSAQLTKFEKDMKSAGNIADRQVRQIEDRFKSLNPGAGGFLNDFSRNMLATVASAFALEQSILKIRQAVGQVDDLGDLAERIGMSTNALQALRFTIGQNGGEAELADRAFDKFSDTIAEAALGAGYLEKVFKANGVALRESNGTLKTNEQLLTAFARLVANAGSAQEKLKLATDAFGRQAGPKMVGTLEQIASKGLPALISEAQAAGVVLDEALIAKASELDKAFKRVEERSAAAFKKMAVDWGGPLLLETFKGLEVAVKMFALSFDLLASGRVREALGIISRLEAAQQRIAVGAGTQLTGDEATSFYDAVGVPKPTRVTVGPKTKLPNAGDAKKDSFQRLVEQTEKSIAVTNVETQTIDLNTFARERARKVVELETVAKQANKEAGLGATTVTAAQRAQIELLADAYARAKVAAEAANGPLVSFAREARNTDKLLQDTAVQGLRSLEDALLDIVTGAATAQDAFKKMANAIINDLARMAIRQSITGPLASVLGGLTGGGGGETSFMPGASFLSGNPIGLAGGGEIPPGGLAYVGEHGPNPRMIRAGNEPVMVTPSDVARPGGSSGGALSLSMPIAVDARGAQAGVAEQIEAAMRRVPLIAIKTIQDAKSRGRRGI